jgi:hypothetical protein
MNTVQRFLIPFLCAFVAGPTFLVLHEWGHFIAGRSLGWSAKLHYAETQVELPNEKFSRRSEVLFSSAGPLLQAILAAAGFLCLRRSRLHRLKAVATTGDWVATSFVLANVGRWFRCLAAPPSRPMPDDEAYISRAMGQPGWLLPYLLGAVAIIAVVATIRLHPPGDRLMPFLAWSVGGVVGALLWMKVVGPFLLP